MNSECCGALFRLGLFARCHVCLTLTRVTHIPPLAAHFHFLLLFFLTKNLSGLRNSPRLHCLGSTQSGSHRRGPSAVSSFCIGYFSHCDQILKKQCMEGRICSDSQLAGVNPRRGVQTRVALPALAVNTLSRSQRDGHGYSLASPGSCSLCLL